MPAPGYETYGDPIDQKNRWNQKQDDNSEGQQCGYQGPFTCLENMEWKIIEGPFISVWLHNVPWASEDAMPAPNAKVCSLSVSLSVGGCARVHTYIHTYISPTMAVNHLD